MKTTRNFLKVGAILIGVIGFSTFLSSCKKEKDCVCTLGEGEEAQEMVITTNGDCDVLEFSYESISLKPSCKEK